MYVKLKQLTEHLLNLCLFSAEKLDSYVDDSELELITTETTNGLKLCNVKYGAVIEIEDFSESAERLIAELAIWLCEQDPQRFIDNLPMPNFSVDVNQDDTANLEIGIEFEEEIILSRNDAGEINYLGQNWSLEAVPVDTAEIISVTDGTTSPPDANYEFGD